MAHPERRFAVRRRPFWMPASSYYVLTLALAAAFFFIVWGVLRDMGTEGPWTTAGVSSSFLIIGSVLFRELIMRRRRERYLRDERGFANERVFQEHFDTPGYGGKLTVEQNAALLREIKKRSDAANVLSKFSGAHREVFELCAEYLNLIEGELSRMNAGSPRLESFLMGRTRAGEAHRFHMLRWAEIEATDLAIRAQNEADPNNRGEAAGRALSIIDTALTAYPNEKALVDSRSLLVELTVSMEAGDAVDRAEKAAARGDRDSAANFYRQALLVLGRDNIRTPARDEAAGRIRLAIERL